MEMIGPASNVIQPVSLIDFTKVPMFILSNVQSALILLCNLYLAYIYKRFDVLLKISNDVISFIQVAYK